MAGLNLALEYLQEDTTCGDQSVKRDMLNFIRIPPQGVSLHDWDKVIHEVAYDLKRESQSAYSHVEGFVRRTLGAFFVAKVIASVCSSNPGGLNGYFGSAQLQEHLDWIAQTFPFPHYNIFGCGASKYGKRLMEPSGRRLYLVTLASIFYNFDQAQQAMNKIANL